MPSEEQDRLTQMMEHHGQQCLSVNEYAVMAMRLGIGTPEGKLRTLKDIGTYMAIAPEEVRVIERRALSKLRHPRWNRTRVLAAVPDVPEDPPASYVPQVTAGLLSDLEAFYTSEAPDSGVVKLVRAYRELEARAACPCFDAAFEGQDPSGG